MFEHLRARSRPKQYTYTVNRLGFFKWCWIVSERTWYPPSTDGPTWQETTIIYGNRHTRRRANQVGKAMRDGFNAMPLPGQP